MARVLIESTPTDYDLNRSQYDELRSDLETLGFEVIVDTTPPRGTRRHHAVRVKLLAAGSYGTAAQVGKHLTRRLRGRRTGAFETERIPIYNERGELLDTVRLFAT